MKILMVNKFLYPNGGSETYIFKLGDYLKSIGHEVQYFGMQHEGNCVGNNAGQYTQDMDFHGGSALSKLTYPIKTIYSTEAKKKIKLVLEDFQPDVVHLNNFNYQLTPSVIYAVRAFEKKHGKKIKIVYTAHDYQLVCPNHMMYNASEEICAQCLNNGFLSCTKGRCIHGSLVKSIVGTAEASLYKLLKTYRQIDTIICCSAFMKSQLDRNPIFADKTVVLHNFIDKPTETDTKKDDYVLYFGRYSKEKGIETLAKAESIVFTCAGSGPLEDYVDNQPNLKNVGFKTGEELEALIRHAKCSVYPSIWYENCPFSVMESIRFGTPVVGADIGGIPELIESGKTGFLFESGNADALKAAVCKILENDTLASEMSENCLKAEFDTVEEYCDKLMNGIYN